MASAIVIAHNIRSVHNVGAIFRTSEGFGVKEIIISGYTPYPALPTDTRLPHLRDKITQQIHKTALGAENLVPFRYTPEVDFAALRRDGYRIVALEQHPRSIPLPDYQPPERVALVLGEEVAGITANLLKHCDDIVEIPMRGRKESFNVSVACGISLYHLSVV